MDENGRTQLFYLAHENGDLAQIDGVRGKNLLFLMAGSSLNHEQELGFSALFSSTNEGFSIALLVNGADSLRTWQGQTTSYLEHAVFHDHTLAVRFYIHNHLYGDANEI